MKPNRIKFEGIFNEIEKEILDRAVEVTLVSLVQESPVHSKDLHNSWRMDKEEGVVFNNAAYADHITNRTQPQGKVNPNRDPINTSSPLADGNSPTSIRNKNKFIERALDKAKIKIEGENK